jgi:hypothetical protein
MPDDRRIEVNERQISCCRVTTIIQFFDLHKQIFPLLFSLRNAAPLVLLWLLAQR